MTEDCALSLAPYIRVHFCAGDVLCDVFPSGRRLKLRDLSLFNLFAKLPSDSARSTVTSLASSTLGLSHKRADELVEALCEVGLFVHPEVATRLKPSLNEWVESGWMDALFLHVCTRNLEFDDDRLDPLALDAALRKLVFDHPLSSLFLDVKGTAVELPQPSPLPDEPLPSTIERRRSGGSWRPAPLLMSELSALLVHANSHSRSLRLLIESELAEHPRLLVNSAFCALETYVIVNDVCGLPPGLYHFDLRNRQLVLMKNGDQSESLQQLCIGQERVRGSRCAMLLSIRWERYSQRYRHSRAFRTLMIDVAESAHNYILIATLLGLGTFITPAVDEDLASSIISEGQLTETIFYVVAIG